MNAIAFSALLLASAQAQALGLHEAALAIEAALGNQHTESLTYSVHLDSERHAAARLSVALVDETARADEKFHQATDRLIADLASDGFDVDIARTYLPQKRYFDGQNYEGPFVEYHLKVRARGKETARR